MSKYSEIKGMSDFEINKLIADIQGYEYEIGVCYPEPPPENKLDYQYINKKVTNIKKFWKHIDYCKHYSDAMPLMIENKMTLRPVIPNDTWHVIGDFIMNKDGSGSCVSSVHKNPCRSIAETYLLMKDAERGDEDCRDDFEKRNKREV